METSSGDKLNDKKMSNNTKAKSKKQLYAEYLKTHNLEKLVSEMTNSVVHELAPNPIVYMIKYLTGLLSEDDRASNGINIEPPYPQGVPIVYFPKFKTTNILSKYLNRDLWQSLKYIKTKYNNNINNLTYISNNSNDPIGICLVDGDCIFSYDEILDNIIREVHNIKDIKKENFFRTNNFKLISKDDMTFIDKMKDKLNMVKFQFCRNIDGYSFNNSNKNNSKVKEDIVNVINGLIEDGTIDNDVKLYTDEKEYKDIINDVAKEEIEWMKNAGIDENDKDNSNSEKPPISNRCVYSNNDHSIVFLINFANHFEMVLTYKKNDSSIDIVKIYNKAINILKNITINFQFEVHEQFGYLTSDISLLGAGMRFCAELSLSNALKCKEMIKGQNFTSYNINSNSNSIIISQNYHLNEENEIAFIVKTLSKLCGLIVIDSYNKNTLSYDKIDFTSKDDSYNKAYEDTYDIMKYTITSNGYNINNIIKYYNSESGNDLILFNKHDYYSFYPFISKYLQLEQNFNCDLLNHINKPENPRKITKIANEEYLSRIHSINICLFRNIHPFNFSIHKDTDTEKIEKIIINSINNINTKGHYADYYSLTDPSTKVKANEIIQKNNLQIYHNEKMKQFNMQSNFPNNSGVLEFYKDNVYGVINDLDHIKLYYNLSKPKGDEDICRELVDFIKVINELSKYIPFEYDNKFGFFTAIPKYIGTGMKIEIVLELDNCDEDEIKDWVKGKGYTWKIKEKNIYQFENKISIGMTETEMLCNLLYYMKDVIDIDIENED